MRYEYITKIEIKFDKKKTFNRKSIKYLQNFIFQESVKLPGHVTPDLIGCLNKKVQNFLKKFCTFIFSSYICSPK